MCTRINKIEKRILQITKLIARDSVQRGLSGKGIERHFVEDQMKAEDAPLLKEKEQLDLKRQFILDRRNSLFWRIIWNIIVPISVTLITTFVISRVGLFSK